jgi:hypothetical protein
MKSLLNCEAYETTYFFADRAISKATASSSGCGSNDARNPEGSLAVGAAADLLGIKLRGVTILPLKNT